MSSRVRIVTARTVEANLVQPRNRLIRSYNHKTLKHSRDINLCSLCCIGSILWANSACYPELERNEGSIEVIVSGAKTWSSRIDIQITSKDEGTPYTQVLYAREAASSDNSSDSSPELKAVIERVPLGLVTVEARAYDQGHQLIKRVPKEVVVSLNARSPVYFDWALLSPDADKTDRPHPDHNPPPPDILPNPQVAWAPSTVVSEFFETTLSDSACEDISLPTRCSEAEFIMSTSINASLQKLSAQAQQYLGIAPNRIRLQQLDLMIVPENSAPSFTTLDDIWDSSLTVNLVINDRIRPLGVAEQTGVSVSFNVAQEYLNFPRRFRQLDAEDIRMSISGTLNQFHALGAVSLELQLKTQLGYQ